MPRRPRGGFPLSDVPRRHAYLHAMPYLQFDGRPVPLLPGENDIGNAESARVRVETAPAARMAVVVLAPEGSAVIRRVGDARVHVNGVALGVEPTPLLHGDKVEVGESALTFGDDRKAGNTAFVQSVRMPQAGAGTAAAPSAPGAVASSPAVAGRLVSLVDGREYAVPAHGLVIGRDPTCDVVVASDEVSRKHATVTPSTGGYVLVDSSANGVMVNGERVASRRGLARGDRVVVGREEFRFYADPAAAAPAPANPATPVAERPPAAAAAPALAAAATPAPAASPAARPPLATLEVVSTGLMHGRVFPIHTPLAHIGRGAHNDVVLAEESVSDSHAKLQKREAGWFVVDMGSTNGTYVGGRRVEGEGEAALVGAPDLRVGGVKFIFRAAADAADGAGHTRAIAAMSAAPRATGAAEPERARPAPVRAAPDPGPAPRGVPVLWVVIAVAVVIALILLLKGR